VLRRLTAAAATVAVTALVAPLVGSCSSDNAASTGVTISVLVDGLVGPTQVAEGPDGSLVVAQINGDEAAATGQVLAVDTASGERRVLLDGLDKPTGVWWSQGVLWVMVRRGLVRAPWPSFDAEVGEVRVVLDDLPFNGRSQGSLTGLADGRLLYATTGSLAGGRPVEGSGTLWVFDPVSGSSTPVAVGAKNAYGHAVLDDGRIVTTEIGDSATEPPVEELDIVALPAPGAAPVDLGWPECPGDRSCEGVIDPVATFEPSSTPTGVAVRGDVAYVALFVPGRVERVDLATGARSTVQTFAAPHSLLLRDDGTMLVTEFGAGRVSAVRL
jgi:glucose/arabinose dehydrogenase